MGQALAMTMVLYNKNFLANNQYYQDGWVNLLQRKICKFANPDQLFGKGAFKYNEYIAGKIFQMNHLKCFSFDMSHFSSQGL